ncbi:serine/threonine-protein kinase 36 isoform X2 [Clupea harengus]|uniref:non-specific serine/threonine protein kinase n=1 Tax=Clupea harengus TaxID=7950 RepID=A0A6P8FJ15_CLUHA|nr:serine/threonine-protein kinase 36 isoform X2 [Clupea harengus]
MENYHVLEMIGEGSFGRVYKGRRKYSGQAVALKFIPKVGRSEKELRSLKREIDIMRGLKHPNIVLLLDSFETDREVVVVTEYAEGELFQILEDDGSLPESQVRAIACQLVSALFYLHSHRILHRDMKPQNILLGKGGVVKLCDFGFARAMSVSTLVLTSIKGTPLYMSPELVEEKPYDHTADLWSLGCILYELHTGVPPFYTNSIFQLVQLIVKDPVKWPESMGPGCTNFLQGLLTKDPQKRLSWPHLLHHPFVADGVLVLSDEGSSSPLTIIPSPDVQAQRQLQAAEKTAPSQGESKLLRKAREQRDKERRARQTGMSKMVPPNQTRSKTAPAGKTPSSDNTLTACSQPPANCTRVIRARSAPSKGQISRDYEREFPSVDVGPRQVMKRTGSRQSNLGSVRMDSEDIDSDEEWQKFAQVTDWTSQVLVDSNILSRLKGKLLASKEKLLDGMLEGASEIREPLKVLSNVLISDPEQARQVCQEVRLPHFLFDLIEDVLGTTVVLQQAWSGAVLGDLMSVVLVYWERHPEWEVTGRRLEDLSKLFLSVLLRPDPHPLVPLSASVLTLFTHRGVHVEVGTDRLVAMLKHLLTDPEEFNYPLPPNWGICDGLLSLLLYTVSEGEIDSLSWLLDSGVWCHLWVKVGTSLEKTTKMAFVSLNGLCELLSLAMFAFSREPHSCVPLLSDSSTLCVSTLSRLLNTHCAELIGSGGFWGDAGTSSLPVMSCHLLCFPFALEMSPEKVAQILQSYHSANVVKGLVQVIQSFPPSLLELPLTLLCRLSLCDPQRSVPSFTAAAWDRGFFSLPGDGGLGRTEQSHGQLHQSGSGTDRSKRHLPPTERGEDQSKEKMKGDVSNCQPKSRTPQAIGRSDQMWGGNVSLLKDSLDQHSAHVQEIMDSLESTDLLSEHRAQLKRTQTQFRESRVVDHPTGKTDQPSASGAGDQPTGPARIRTASALLSLLLEDVSLSGCAAELISLLSQVARSSIRSSLVLIPLDPAPLRAALQHPEDSIRAAVCSLLGNLDPLVGMSKSHTDDTSPSWTAQPVLLQDLVGCLSDSSPSVRKRACRAVGTWLGLIALAGPGEGTLGQSHEPKANRNTGASSCPVWGRGRGRGERRGSTGMCGNRSALRGQDSEGWAEVALGAVAPLVVLLRDPDALTRQHSCSALGNAAGLRGGRAALLEADAQRLLLHAAQADSQHAVQRAAAATLCMLKQQDVQEQVKGSGGQTLDT